MPDGAASAVPGPIHVDPASLPPTALHLLPCEIRHDGAAAVSRYFSPAVRPTPSGWGDEAGGTTTPMGPRAGRGGRWEAVPARPASPSPCWKAQRKEPGLGSQGSWVRIPTLPLERTVRATTAFSSFTAWGLETAPGPDAGIHGALVWPGLAAAVSKGGPSLGEGVGIGEEGGPSPTKACISPLL
uniref:Uncharacterized protein n=1 Tax=Ornithorhynchus anatinus TaxID=9258 RepID=A0A6I8NG07_ORNAN